MIYMSHIQQSALFLLFSVFFVEHDQALEVKLKLNFSPCAQSLDAEMRLACALGTTVKCTTSKYKISRPNFQNKTLIYFKANFFFY